MRTLAEAHAVMSLENLLEMNKLDRVQQVGYIGEKIDEKLKEQGAICGGHEACLLGSLWLASGEKALIMGPSHRHWFDLEGIDEGEREPFFQDGGKVGLQIAYTELNLAALEILTERYGYPEQIVDDIGQVNDWDIPLEHRDRRVASDWHPEYMSPAEQLFEITLKGRRKSTVHDTIDEVARRAIASIATVEVREKMELAEVPA